MDKMTKKMLQKSADTALEMTAQSFGMEKSTVAKIVQIGLPMQKKAMSENPESAKRVYRAAVQTTPEEVQDFYRSLATNPKLAEIGQKEYKEIFGASAQAICDAASAQIEGVTSDQAAQVMGAMMPAFKAEMKVELDAAEGNEAKGGSWIGNP